tara:strand:- start:721 stop:1329 length:609 start_codon:yes stop_codon:yes gene_type:complete
MAEEAIDIKNQEALDYLGQMEGPVPGQSLTSNPNEPSPWEKPPTHTTLNSALHSLFDMMTEEETYINIVTALGEGMPVTNMTQMILEDGFQKGAWNPDLMLQLLEPTMFMIMSMAEKAGVKYRIDEEDDPDEEKIDDEQVSDVFNDLAKVAEGNLNDKTVKEEALPKDISEKIRNIQVPESLLAKPETEETIEETNSLLARG